MPRHLHQEADLMGTSQVRKVNQQLPPDENVSQDVGNAAIYDEQILRYNSSWPFAALLEWLHLGAVGVYFKVTG